MISALFRILVYCGHADDRNDSRRQSLCTGITLLFTNDVESYNYTIIYILLSSTCPHNALESHFRLN